MWRLYHATKDGRLFNYPVHLSRASQLDYGALGEVSL
jgi:hypothetical protein